MNSDDVDYDTLSFVIGSKYRIGVLEALEESPATPSTLADRSQHSIAHTSRALQELRDWDLVELLVPEERKKGRIYGLTEAGVGLADRAMEVEAV